VKARTFRIVDAPWAQRGKHFDTVFDLVWEHQSIGDGLIESDEFQGLQDIVLNPGGLASNRDIPNITIPVRLFERMVWTILELFRLRRGPL
jgi:hypothetical protein